MTNEQQMDPKVQQALTEISATLKKYDLGAFIQVQSEDSSEFQTVFPSWSVAQFRKMQDGKPALAMTVDPKNPKAVQLGEQTIGFLLTMRDVCARQSLILDGVMKQVGQHLNMDVKTIFGRSKQSQPPTVQ